MQSTNSVAERTDPLVSVRWNAKHRRNLPQIVADRAERTPDEAFLYIGDETISYGAFHNRAMAWAATFQSLGVKAGDHVFTFTEARIDAYCLWLGLAWIGAVEVPINPAYRGSVLLHAIHMADAKLAVLSPTFVERVREVAADAPAFETVLVLGDEPLENAGTLPIVREAAAFAAAGPLDTGMLIDPQAHHIACIIFTSGTTGPAKAVLVPWGQMIAAAYMQRADQEDEDRWNMNEQSMFYAFFPAFHMSGRYALFLTIARGARMAYRATFSVENFWTDVDRYGATHAQLLAPMMAFLMTKPESEQDLSHSLICVNGGPPGDVCDRFMRRYGIRVRTGFGMTEIGGPIGTPWLSPDSPPRSCGVAVPGAPEYELRIVDENDYPVTPGEPGELIVRTSDPWALNAGYYKMPEETAKAWRNGWFHTGDMLRIDEAGEYHFVDRRKDCIRRRGENISSFEIESFVIQHPAVLEVAAIPHPSDYGTGEDEVKICVVAKPGAQLDPAGLHAWLAERMPRYMVPRFIEVMLQLPKTEATQRVQKATLRLRGNGPDTWDSNRPTG